MTYEEFLQEKTQLGGDHGFEPLFMPAYLFDFQEYLISWALRKGRAAIFADCGLGKTPMQLVWAQNVVMKTGGKVLILAPLAVSQQIVHEAEKFGIEARRSRDGQPKGQITVTNYEQLEKFDAGDFIGCVCDESSILKNLKGKTKTQIVAFMRKLPYRLLATATPAPNDFIELGTSSEALGQMGAMDMMARFFKNDQNNIDTRKKWTAHGGGVMPKWSLKPHAELPFWRWLCSWSRAIRKPSDLGFDDSRFMLPELVTNEHLIEPRTIREGFLFNVPAIGMSEQKEERRRTIAERCEAVANLCKHEHPSLVWCHFNQEGDELEKMIPDSIQVSGKDDAETQESKLIDFATGNARVLVTKPQIGAWGLNFQHCNHMTFFPSHSFEQYYQGVRRCWRFGQKRPVTVDIVTTEGEGRVMKNLLHKANQADQMFARLVQQMDNVLHLTKENHFNQKEIIPSWL